MKNLHIANLIIVQFCSFLQCNIERTLSALSLALKTGMAEPVQKSGQLLAVLVGWGGL